MHLTQRLSHCLGCPHPVLESWLPALALPPVQLPAQAHPGKQQVTASAWIPTPHVGDPDLVASSWLWPGPVVAVTGI